MGYEDSGVQLPAAEARQPFWTRSRRDWILTFKDTRLITHTGGLQQNTPKEELGAVDSTEQ